MNGAASTRAASTIHRDANALANEFDDLVSYDAELTAERRSAECSTGGAHR